MAIQRQTCLDLIARLSTVVHQGRQLDRHLSGVIGPAKRPGCPSVNAFGVLLVLEGMGGTRVTDLAAELNVDASVLSRKAAALERDGFVARDPDPRDRRVAHLYITAEGRRALRDWQRGRADWLRQALNGWSDADARVLVTLLDRLWTDVSSAAGNASAAAGEPGHTTQRDHTTGPAQALTTARTGER